MSSAFLENPGEQHWIAAKHVLRYSKGTVKDGLVYSRSPNGVFSEGYSDTDWAGNEGLRKSTSGYCFRLSDTSACVSWSTKVHGTLATSTVEAETIAYVSAAQECVYLFGLLGELGMSVNEPVCLYVDNQAIIVLSKHAMHHGKTKHFAIKLHFLRELCEEEKTKLVYTPTEKQPADLLTERLGRIKTKTCMDFLLACRIAGVSTHDLIFVASE